jgi:hypothetical protein
MTEAFSDEALDPVSVNGATCALLGDRQAQPGMSLSVRANEQREIPIRKPVGIRVVSSDGRRDESERRKKERRHRLSGSDGYSGSGRQPRAPFCAARPDHFSTVAGCHTRAKTMGSRSLDAARLKGSFHLG